MSFVTRERFLARARDFVDVDVSEWYGDGQTMRIWQMTAEDAMKYAMSFYDETGKRDPLRMINARARLLVYTLGNDVGRLFKDGDEPILEQFDAGLFNALYTAAQKLTGLDASEQELAALFALRQPSKQPSA
jgi:hypothetical protein